MSWLIRRLRRPGAATHLYCFPHAGGAPGEYARFADDLPQTQVWAVQAPGRASRLHEAPYTDLPSLVDALLGAVRFEPPFALFGHSLGALVAFEVSRALRDRGRERPAHLVVSACSPPPLTRTGAPLHRMDDTELLTTVERRWGPLPAPVREDPQLRAAALGCHRADFEILETYAYVPGEPLEHPITAVAGDLERAGAQRAAGWRRHTSAGFEQYTVHGGHFYFRDDRGPLSEILRRAVTADAVPQERIGGISG